MKMIDKHGADISQEAIDLAKGHLVPERILVACHEAVEAVPEQGHWHTGAEYPNGGKELHWVVDVPGVEGAQAREEYQHVLRYVEYTAEELAQREALHQQEQQRAERLDKLLQSAVLREELTDLLVQLLPKLWNGMEGSEPTRDD